MPNEIRCFIAIDLPAHLISKLTEITTFLDHELTRSSPGKHHLVRWTSANKIHLTIKFLGNVGAHLVDKLKEPLASALVYPKFELSIEKLGIFPKPSRPRIIWVGINPSTAIMTIQKSIENCLEKEGFRKEERPFKAHITIGRVEPTLSTQDFHQVGKLVLKAANEINFMDSIFSFPVNSVHFYQSSLLQSGAIYSHLFSIPLL